MLKLLGYLLLIGFILVLVKLFLSFLMALFTLTIVAFISLGPIMMILSFIGLVESDTAWLIVKCAAGLGFVIDVVRVIKNPGEVISATRDIYNSSSSSGEFPSSDSNEHEKPEKEYPCDSDRYTRCCGSCKWFSGHSSLYSVCQMKGSEVSHSDYCGSWQRS